MREHRESIMKICLSAIMLAAFMAVTHFIDITWWIRLLMFLVPYLIIGGGVLREAAENILQGEVFDECFLMSIATLGAFAIGEYPEAVFVMLFFQVGELFEHIASDRSRKSITSLMDIRPDSVNLETQSGLKVVAPETVNKHDIIIIKPGERVPLDGIVIEGESSLNTTALTGEALPLDVSQGEKVISGCVNGSGLLRVRVSGVYAESTAAKILQLVENSSAKKAKTEGFITRFSKVYTPVVVILALLLALLPSLVFGGWAMWIERALIFLVVSCPCALVVSVPLTYFSGIGGASGKGILVKGAVALEKIAAANTVVFDKTGTLTKGSFFVTAVHPQVIDENELLEIAAAAERFSDHPISHSLKAACKGDCNEQIVKDVEEISGFGVKAKVDGREVLVGNDKLMKSSGIPYRNCHKNGTIVHVSVNGEYAGHIVISDVVKSESKAAVQKLKNAGINTVMLTGDREEAAMRVAGEVGIDRYYAELLPADKVRILEEIMAKESPDKKTAFVGDGINDAPVLARADIGIAMGALGSDAAIEAADLVLMDDNVEKIPLAIRISQKTNSIVKQNIVFSLAVKFGVLAISAAGFSNMWIASFADVGVLVIAVLNAVRAMKIKDYS